jgi:hypothetical protein
MSTPLEVIQEGEGVFWQRLVDTYSIKNEDRPKLDTSSSLFGIKGMIDDVYQSQTLELLQALHDELEGKKKPLIHDVNWAEGYNAANQKQ